MKKRLKILLILLIIIVVIVIFFNTSLGRYVYNSIGNHILESQNFYFNSTVLKANDETYSISNWDGVNTFSLNIDVNNKKNELISTTVDISYDIDYVCPETVICSISKESGVIYADSKTDSYILNVTPIINFDESDEVVVKTSATSTFPYKKTLSATYIIGVENYGFSYTKTDSVGSKYMVLELTNSKPYYEVKEAFASYNVGDYISLDDYNNLNNLDKAKCVSVRVKITFEPYTLLLDMTDNAYINSISSTTRNLNGYYYVDSFIFDLSANSSEKIIFYKNDVSKDYSNNEDVLTIELQN